MQVHTKQSLLVYFEDLRNGPSHQHLYLNGGTTIQRENRRDHFDNIVAWEFFLEDTFSLIDCDARFITLASHPYVIKVNIDFSDQRHIESSLKSNQIISVKLKFSYSDFFCTFRYPHYSLKNTINSPVVKEYHTEKPYLNILPTGIYHLAYSHDTVKTNNSCFIATAATGSYEHPMVKDLRVFRDQILLSSQIGSAFVNWYYTKSPRIAAYIGKNKISRFLTRNFFVRPLAFIARFLTRK
jgi:hypothetical protein